ncbi:hypothetical protein U5801_19095 [Lamprobacter modestohalophilus]|uniref:hypothetical protein n=1 Tax=Lamprobacter modestohalophilus TaxID=1064514 RepID=UPI002ADEB3AD|nr:hypothetical protein [Lamprobacter modestohalophilus]MEA1051896.1 hypothetical protein [Lamprobacter modestohalophilus]
MSDIEFPMLFATFSEWLPLANVMLTAIFAGLTFFILRANRAAVTAMREQLIEQTRPFVHVAVRTRVGAPVLQLTIKNVGKSPAQNLRLQIDRDFFQFGDKQSARNLAMQTAFTQPIDCLPPDTELLFDLDTGPHLFGPDADPKSCPLNFVISADYQHRKHTYSEKTNLDLHPFIGVSVPEHPVVEELGRIRQSIDKLGKIINQSASAISTDKRRDQNAQHV